MSGWLSADWAGRPAPKGGSHSATLTVLEIVLGIDNIVFISILAGKLPQEDRARAQEVGLVAGDDHPHPPAAVDHVGDGPDGAAVHGARAGDLRPRSDPDRRRAVSLGKSTLEIHEKLEGVEGHGSAKVAQSFAAVIVQILLLDIVFSLDSVITAVGMADDVAVDDPGGDHRRRRDAACRPARSASSSTATRR